MSDEKKITPTGGAESEPTQSHTETASEGAKDQTKESFSKDESENPQHEISLKDAHDNLMKSIMTRRGKLSVVTRKMNDTERLMLDVDVENVKLTMDEFFEALNSFNVAHNMVQSLLSEEERGYDQEDWYEPKMYHFRGFQDKILKWLHTITQEVIAPQDVSPSPSQAASNKSSGKSSTRRIEAEAEKAALIARAQTLKEKHALEMEEARIKARKEELALEADLAATTAKIKVMDEHEQSSQLTHTKQGKVGTDKLLEDIPQRSQADAMEAYFQGAVASQEGEVDVFHDAPQGEPEIKPFPANAQRRQSRAFELFNPSPPIASSNPSPMIQSNPIPSHTTIGQDGYMVGPSTTAQMQPGHTGQPNVMQSSVQAQPAHSGLPNPMHRPLQVQPGYTNLSNVMQRQNDIADILVRQQRLSELPTKELPVFNGDPLHYVSFIRAFEHGVEDKTDSDRDRLYYLEQHTSGQPKELVQSCLHMEPTTGFREAKRLLKWHFGNEVKITTAYIEKAMNWPAIKPEDGKGLNNFALYLRSCCNAMQNVAYMEELDSPSNMRAVLAKLPFKLRDKWRSVACHLTESRQTRAKFKDLVEFTEKQARISLDPIFGNILDSSYKPKVTQPEPKLRPKSASRGSSFATTIDTSFRDCDEPAHVQDKDKDKGKGKESVTTKKPCIFCTGEHDIDTCKKLKAKPHKEKVEILRRKGLCFGCLKRGHMSKECKRRVICGTCKLKHPTVLHIEAASSTKKTDSSADDTIASALVSLSPSRPTGAGNGNKDSALAIVPVKIKLQKGNKVLNTYAFLDPGSSATFCTEQLMRKLGAEGRRTEIVLRTLNQERPVKSYEVTGLEVSSLDNDVFIQLPKVYTQRKIPVTKDNIPSQEDIDRWSYLKDVKLNRIDSDIGLLIGVNTPKLMEPWRIINSQGNGPYAVRTLLGWVVNGPLNSSPSNATDHHGRPTLTANRISISRIEDLLIQQYNHDFMERSYGDESELSIEEKQFMKIASDSATLKDGHYYMRLPFREENVQMPNNRHVATQRALGLTRRFMKDPAFHDDYKTFMNKVIGDGHAERVPQQQLQRGDGRIWFIPHHGVYHKKKNTIRVVFDCGATYQGISLNGKLLQGPDLTNTLMGVLLRFRQEPIALMADIEGMFHQVRVDPDDVDFLRFLWWPNGDITQSPQEYRMTVHLFGAVSSPSCASFALKKTADDNKDKFNAEVVNTIKLNFYVDDCLKSVPTEEQAISLTEDLRTLCAMGGFKLRKWMSNSRTVLASIPEEEKAKEVKELSLDMQQLPVERALGVRWNVEEDTFTFQLTVKNKQNTRRGILSTVSSVYDPLGFLAPFILTAKQILQELCRSKHSWDDNIPDTVTQRWQNWLCELSTLSGFSVERCLKPTGVGVKHTELHHFCDASEEGYGAVTYLRLTDAKDAVHVRFVVGKSRVAPLKQTTIPRLELAAAVLSARMDRMLRSELQIPLDESVFWTDSTSVLKYIANETRRFRTFVANRVSTIRELSTPEQWRYVSTKLNPADEASRGLRAEVLLRPNRWMNGPDFLARPKDLWPKLPSQDKNLSSDDPEVKQDLAVNSTVIVDDPTVKLLTYFSEWNRLKKAVAWFLKVKEMLKLACKKKPQGDTEMRKEKKRDCLPRACKKKHESNAGKGKKDKEGHPSLQSLSVDEMNQAEEAIISYVQRQYFEEEILILQRGDTIPKRSSLHRLDPWMDGNILRVGGRLNKCAIPMEIKNPIILPKDSHIPKLILTDIHKRAKHAGRNYIISKLRQLFWVPCANALARKIIKNCTICRRQHASVGEQKMADLPLDRVSPDLPAFTSVGVDYFGPIIVKRGRTEIKRYGVLFTCMATRAIHLEMAYSLDTSSCINAIRRFVCRRGQVTDMRSDHGTNLAGAERELREALKEVDQDKIKSTLVNDGIRWTFNPPAGAHHGGVWERMVGLVKKVLYSVLRQQSLDDEGLQTALCEAEAILNDRPISTVTQDPNDLEPLTPNHLLLLKGKPIMPPGLFQQDDLYARRRWRQVQYLANLFWKRWLREYLPLMQERQKWTKKRRSLTSGDVVLVADDTAPRNSWQLGKVIETLPDSRGLVRRVRLRTKTNVIERPITKLCLLQESTADN